MPTKGEIEAQTGGTVSQWFQFNWYFWHEHVTFVCRYVTACLCLGCGWLRFLSKEHNSLVQSVKFSCSVVSDSVTPWTAACQASLSTTNSWSLLKHISIESVMPSSHLILCCPLLLLPSIFPSIRAFQISQLFASGSQSIGVSASASVLPKNTHDWSPLGWTGWISLQSKGLSRVFSNTTVQKHQFFGIQLSL